MKDRTAWRKQEQELVERWSQAVERYRLVHEELSARQLAQGTLPPDDEFVLKEQAARADIETLRRKVARLKREFLSGNRY